MEMVWTFWEGKMPAYIELCMQTWNFPYTVLNYDNLNEYTDLDVDKLKRFTLPQIADCVRVHVLRDHGGYWLDTDTIMLGTELPTTNMIGNARSRTNTIGYLHTEAHSDMFTQWAEYQDMIINGIGTPLNWDVMGNAFTDNYVRKRMNITICDIRKAWPETYMIKEPINRTRKYRKFYFENEYHLSDIEYTDMLMLHNSWTPTWYKKLDKDGVLKDNHTLSNILRELQ